MAYKGLPHPVAGAVLPEVCKVVSIDAESIDAEDSKKGRLVPAAAISVGLTLWHKRGDHMWCERGETGLPRMWHYTIVPTAPAHPKTMADFWAKHPDAWDYATRDPQPAKDVGRHIWALLTQWHRRDNPVALVAQPWAFDGGILDYLLAQFGWEIPGVSVFEIRELLRARHRVSDAVVRNRWVETLKRHGKLSHKADKDAYDQGLAFAELWKTLRTN